MHDVKNVRSPLFGKDRSNPYSVNQRARIVCMNQVNHVVINSVKANDAVYQRIDRGMMGLGLPYPQVSQKDALSRDLHPSIGLDEADDANSLRRNADSATTGTPYPHGIMRRSCHFCDPRASDGPGDGSPEPEKVALFAPTRPHRDKTVVTLLKKPLSSCS